jgi:hypothetical protein
MCILAVSFFATITASYCSFGRRTPGAGSPKISKIKKFIYLLCPSSPQLPQVIVLLGGGLQVQEVLRLVGSKKHTYLLCPSPPQLLQFIVLLGGDQVQDVLGW